VLKKELLYIALTTQQPRKRIKRNNGPRRSQPNKNREEENEGIESDTNQETKTNQG
jgi:hypothetical protein